MNHVSFSLCYKLVLTLAKEYHHSLDELASGTGGKQVERQSFLLHVLLSGLSSEDISTRRLGLPTSHNLMGRNPSRECPAACSSS